MDPEAANYYKWDLTATQFIIHSVTRPGPGNGLAWAWSVCPNASRGPALIGSDEGLGVNLEQ